MKWTALTRLGMFTSVPLTDATMAAPSSTWVQYPKTLLSFSLNCDIHNTHWQRESRRLSVNKHRGLTCVRQTCGYHTSHSTCVFHHTPHHRLLHTDGMCRPGRIDTWCFVEWTFRFRRVDAALASHTALTNKIPDAGASVRVWKNRLCVCVYLRQWGRCHLSNIPFSLQGRISLTNVSERKDKMRLGMTLTSNPVDNSFVVRTS